VFVEGRRANPNHRPQNKIKEIEMKSQVNKSDPNRTETETVQYWRNGIMVTAMMTKETAKELVRTGQAYVINGQAIRATE